ncbi:MAG: AmmeMemoRadiSam system protein A [Gemmatimonadales bacterium]
MIEPLSRDVRKRLLEYARETLIAVVEGRPPGEPLRGGVLNEPSAVFVTLRRGTELRGCLGQTRARWPLGVVVGEMTREAATQDPRFPPVTPEEAPQVQIEISRLSPPVEATRDEIVIGRHGLVIRSGRNVGLLLPQVAKEFGCDVEEFLGLACRKAELPASAWQDANVTIRVFEAEVFGE